MDRADSGPQTECQGPVTSRHALLQRQTELYLISGRQKSMRLLVVKASAAVTLLARMITFQDVRQDLDTTNTQG